jgi:N-acetylglucosamine repressor
MAVTRIGSKRLLRDLNQSIVLKLIVEQGLISRTDLARRSGLPAATITRIAHDFLEAGLISEVASEVSSGGRRPVLLSINPKAGYVIGAKVSRDHVIIALCDLSCTVLYANECSLPEECSPSSIADAITSAVQQCLHLMKIPGERVLGVGVGLAGWIDSSLNICRYSSVFGWRDVELGSELETRLGLSVCLDNDVNALAVGERFFGAGHETDNFLLVTLGSGIGLGIVVDGEIFRGAHGGAGEFGHMTVDTSLTALACHCGKHGCLETIAADAGIAKAALGENIGTNVEEAICIALVRARHGVDTAVNAFHRAGYMLGVAIANLVNIFDPSLILISGEGLRAGELILEPLRSALPMHVFGSARESIKLDVLKADEVDWARGSASLILRKVLQPPIYEEESIIIGKLLSTSQRFIQH